MSQLSVLSQRKKKENNDTDTSWKQTRCDVIIKKIIYDTFMNQLI